MDSERLNALRDFLEREIVPRYDAFDAGHRRDHAHAVMAQSQHLAQYYPEVDAAMLLAAAAYHDLGLAEGREEHHLASGRLIRRDERLREWFTPEQIEVIACAAEDHRASAKHEPRTIYGRIIAESDRLIDAHTIITRALQYGCTHSPELTVEQQVERAIAHLREKYGDGGYLKLWIPESDNAQRLAAFRRLMADEQQLRQLVNQLMRDL